jgi:hypothetical protein
VSLHDLAGDLSVPTFLAIGTAAWVWMLPETRGIALASLGADAAVETETARGKDAPHGPLA